MGATRIYKLLNKQHLIKVKEEFYGFYERCITYLDIWGNSIGNAEQCSGLNVATINMVSREQFESSAELINGSLHDLDELKINDVLFDEVILAKESLQSNWEKC